MPRRDPVTRRHIEKRRELGFGPRIAAPSCECKPVDSSPSNQPSPWCYNFDEALEILGLADVSLERKRACERELNDIISAHRLALRVEDEETPARKAEAFHGAVRLYVDLERISHCITDTSLSEKARKQAVKKWREAMQDRRQLLQSLEHEVARLQLSTGRPLADCCRALEDHYRSKSKLGRNKTYALRNTIHRLQAFASAVDKELTWMDRRDTSSPKRRAKAMGRNIPVDLIRFLTAVLDAAGIKHPSYGGSPAKVRRLMIGSRLRQAR
jgi:hypothetical protein